MLRQATQNLITALYPRLSHEDELQGESNSISNQYENLTGVLKYSPIIQIGEIASRMITTAYFVSTFLSLTFLIVCVLTSAIKFNRTEL